MQWLILLIFIVRPAISIKDCFCSNRIDGYSLSAIQLYFLDYAGKESFEVILDRLVAIYNAVIQKSLDRFPSLPYLQLIGEGFSSRWVFKPSLIDDKYTNNFILKDPKEALATKNVKRYIKQIDNKRVYQLGETTFFVYYYQNRRNRMTWSVEFTTQERPDDLSNEVRTIPEDSRIDPAEEQAVFEESILAGETNSSDLKLAIKDIGGREYKSVNLNSADLKKTGFAELDLSHIKHLRHRHTWEATELRTQWRRKRRSFAM